MRDMKAPSMGSPVDLVSGVRDVLNASIPGQVTADDDPQLDLERDLAAGARMEVAEAALEQELRGNPGSHVGAPVHADEEPAPEEDELATPLDDSELNSVIERELADSLGAESDEVQGARASALDYYFGRPRGDEKVGRSKLQSLDVADMVESILAQVLPSVTSDLTVEFDILGGSREDLVQAEEESLAVDYVVQKENPGFLTFYQLVKDALLLKNCVAKVTPDESLTVRMQEHPGIPPKAVPMFLQVMQSTEPDESLEVDSQELGEDGRVTLRVKRVFKKKKIKVMAVPPDEIRVNSDHDSPNFQDARFVCHDRVMRESQLIAMGYDPEVIADLPSYGSRTDPVSDARAQTSKETDTDTSNPHDRPIRVYECWMLVDADGDGIAERRMIMRCEDGTILENTHVNYMGIVSGTAYINPHKWLGISSYDKLKEVQDYKTHFLRQAADNANHANNARMGYVKGQVSEDDLFNSKPGGGVALKRPDALVPIATPNVLPAVFSMLDYGDKMRTERSGASLDMQSQNIPLQNRTAHGAERVISSMEQITAMVAQTLVNTIGKDIYLAVHQILRDHFPKGYSFPQGSGANRQMKQVQPRQWSRRDSVHLKVGASVGERGRQVSALGAILDQQKDLMAKGLDGTLVDEDCIYRTVMDITRLSGLTNAAQYWVNPSSPEGQQVKQAKAQNMAQAKQEQQAQQQQIIDLQQSVIQAQEQTKRAVSQLKALTEDKKIREDRRQHAEDTANDLTEMELKYNVDLPEKGEESE